MKYFLIAGEASGDLHGSFLIHAIKKTDQNAVFNFWGGDLMAAEANGLLVHYNQNSIMGFVEVLLNLGKISKNFKTCKQQILNFNPDVVIFIDYPGFNLRMAKFCKQNNFKTAYHIAPKVWAWKENRAKKLEKYIDELLLIFPFEVEYFKKWKVKTTYIGNPMAEAIFNFKAEPSFAETYNPEGKPILALLPGSRKFEISKTLPVMLKAVENLTNYKIIVGGAPGMKADYYQQFLNKNQSIVFNSTYNLLANATAAIVCSGTATLETALFNVPQFCGYKANPISMAIAKFFAKTKYISLVNLTLDKPVIAELIQQDFTVEKLQKELNLILPNGHKLPQLLSDYKTIQQKYQVKDAGFKAAEIICGLAKRI